MQLNCLSAKIELSRVYSNKSAQLRKIMMKRILTLINQESSDTLLYAKREDSDKIVHMRQLILVISLRT